MKKSNRNFDDIQAVIISSDEMNAIIIYKDGSYKNICIDDNEVVIKLKRKEKAYE